MSPTTPMKYPAPSNSSADDLRAKGWTVSSHNDYRLKGVPHTFWLLTHPSGRWLKGEGRTDAEALDQIREILAKGAWVAQLCAHQANLVKYNEPEDE